MKGIEKLLTVLNQLLDDKLTAINQYIAHSEMCSGRGYTKLHQAIEKHVRDETHHAQRLIRRIIFLEGMPVVSKLNHIKIGQSVPEMVNNDQNSEIAALLAYNYAIGLAHEVADQGTVDLLTEILKVEERHDDWAEVQRAQIEQMGLENYLTNQTEGAAS